MEMMLAFIVTSETACARVSPREYLILGLKIEKALKIVFVPLQIPSKSDAAANRKI